MKYDALKVVTLVDSKNQLQGSESVRFEGVDNSGLRVLFVGNSVTLHAPCESIGWHGDWGMAASAKERDYVHLVESFVKKTHPDASFCICNAADWERGYRNGEETFPKYTAASAFDANVIIIKISGNSPKNDFDGETFKQNYEKLISFLNPNGTAKVILATEFFKHPAEDAIVAFAKEKGVPLCALSDIADFDEYKAVGLFGHMGVAAHPGDKGMQVIAERIIEKLSRII